MQALVFSDAFSDEPIAPIPQPDALIGLLRTVASASFTCSVRAQGRAESYLSRRFELNDAADAITLDAPRIPVIARSLHAGAIAQMDVMLRHVRLTFESRVLSLNGIGPKAQLQLARPHAVQQRQRHEIGRVTVPASFAMRVSLQAGEPRLSELSVLNLSSGGACLRAFGSLEDFPSGLVFERVRVRLPDGTEVTCAARVSHAVATRLSEIRVGVQFMRTSPDAELALARCIEEAARDDTTRTLPGIASLRA